MDLGQRVQPLKDLLLGLGAVEPLIQLVTDVTGEERDFGDLHTV